VTGNASANGGHNEGIQANTVQAEVLAVWRGAQATKYSTAADAEALSRAVGELHAAIAALALPAPARQVLDQDVRALADVAGHEQPDPQAARGLLKGIADKLKMVGIVLTEAVGLAEPVGKIANLLRIPLGFLTGS